MKPFTYLDGLVCPLDRANVDTDAIIPKQYLTSIKRTGYGPTAFDEWRYLDKGLPGMDHDKRPKNPDFPMNDPRYQGATILFARKNFGCGSSREHAVWALHQAGFKAIVAPDYGDIFLTNSMKNGLLCIALKPDEVDALFKAAMGASALTAVVDLEAQTVSTKDGSQRYGFQIDPFRKHCLLNGLDDVALTLAKSDQIKAFEQQHRAKYPWLQQPL